MKLRSKKMHCVLFCLCLLPLGGQSNEIIEKNFPKNKSIQKELLQGKIFAQSKVKTLKAKKQEMKFTLAGIHPRNCRRAMRKLSRYEDFPQFINYVKSMQYNEVSRQLSCRLDAIFLPFAMHLSFKIDRIQGAGRYAFTFEHGFLRGLEGQIELSDLPNEQCFFHIKADWIGADTGFPDFVLSLFTETLGRIGMERLFKISRF